MEGLKAVIDIGASAIRLLVAEPHEDEKWKIIDSAQRPVTLGRDAFGSGVISRESLQQAINILNGYRELLSGWKIPHSDVRVIGTSALREAQNRDTFIDRINLRTGFKVEVVEGIEENRLTYMAVKNAIREYNTELNRANSMIIEVGGGSTEIMMLRRGKMVAAHSLNIGTVRLAQQLGSVMQTRQSLDRFLVENIRTTKEMLDEELPLRHVRIFIAVGGDARIAARTVGTQVDEHYAMIEKDTFVSWLREIRDLPISARADRFKIPYTTAEGLIPALLVYEQFVSATGSSQLLVPDVSIRDGVLLSFFGEEDSALQEEFDSQILASARALGKKYHYDEGHAEHVAELSLGIFDQLAQEHNVDSHGRLILHVAGLLHDIGTFVKTSGHHKHSMYLIMNSDIFGLNRDDLRILSNIVRYHRKSLPVSSHIPFVSMPMEHRLLVMKLAAILRVADALDRGHRQRIQELELEKRGDDFVIHSSFTGDTTLERYGLSLKANMFEEVFGARIRLE